MPSSAKTEGEILARLIRSGVGDFPAEAARVFLKLEFSDDDRREMNALAEKARRGELSNEDDVAIRSYERVNNFLGILKSQARQSLKFSSDKAI